MRGVNIYAPLLGLFMVLTVVGISIYFNSSEKSVLSTLESSARSYTQLSLSRVLLWDAITGADAAVLRYSIQKLGNLSNDEADLINSGDFSPLIPTDPLIYFVSVFAREVQGPVTDASVDVLSHDRQITLNGNILMVEDNYDARITFNFDNGRMAEVVVPSPMINIVPLDAQDLLDKVSILKNLEVRAWSYMGLCQDGYNNLCFISFDEGSGSFVRITAPVCDSVEDIVRNALPYLVEKYKNDINNQLMGSGITVENCIPITEVLPDTVVEGVTTSYTFTGMEVKELVCTFHFPVDVYGLGSVLTRVKSVVRIINTSPYTPPSFHVRYDQSGCLIKA